MVLQDTKDLTYEAVKYRFRIFQSVRHIFVFDVVRFVQPYHSNCKYFESVTYSAKRLSESQNVTRRLQLKKSKDPPRK